MDLGERRNEGGDWKKERERELYSGCMDVFKKSIKI